MATGIELTESERLVLTPNQQEVYVLIKNGRTRGTIIKQLGLTEKQYDGRATRITQNLTRLSTPSVVAPNVSVGEVHLAQLKMLKRQITSLTTAKAFESHVLDLLSETLKPYSYRPPKLKITKTPDSEELILVLSDWHFGETVSEEEVLGMNKYDDTIAIGRVNNIYRAVESFLRKMSGARYTKLNIFCLGDMVTGIIHEELLLNGLPVVEQVVECGDALGALIARLSKHFPEIEVTCIRGNHGRMNKKVSFKQSWNNFDWLAYQFAERRLRSNPRVSFNIPKAPMAIVDILGYKNLLMHGESIKSHSGTPIYGVKRADATVSQTLVSEKNVILNNLFMAHFHQLNTLERAGGEICMAGSLKGGDEYSFGKMYKMGVPRQSMYSIHPKYGINHEFKLYCGENR